MNVAADSFVPLNRYSLAASPTSPSHPASPTSPTHPPTLQLHNQYHHHHLQHQQQQQHHQLVNYRSSLYNLEPLQYSSHQPVDLPSPSTAGTSTTLATSLDPSSYNSLDPYFPPNLRSNSVHYTTPPHLSKSASTASSQPYYPTTPGGVPPPQLPYTNSPITPVSPGPQVYYTQQPVSPTGYYSYNNRQSYYGYPSGYPFNQEQPGTVNSQQMVHQLPKDARADRVSLGAVLPPVQQRQGGGLVGAPGGMKGYGNEYEEYSQPGFPESNSVTISISNSLSNMSISLQATTTATTGRPNYGAAPTHAHINITPSQNGSSGTPISASGDPYGHYENQNQQPVQNPPTMQRSLHSELNAAMHKEGSRTSVGPPPQPPVSPTSMAANFGRRLSAVFSPLKSKESQQQQQQQQHQQASKSANVATPTLSLQIEAPLNHRLSIVSSGQPSSADITSSPNPATGSSRMSVAFANPASASSPASPGRSATQKYSSVTSTTPSETSAGTLTRNGTTSASVYSPNGDYSRVNSRHRTGATGAAVSAASASSPTQQRSSMYSTSTKPASTTSASPSAGARTAAGNMSWRSSTIASPSAASPAQLSKSASPVRNSPSTTPTGRAPSATGTTRSKSVGRTSASNKLPLSPEACVYGYKDLLTVYEQREIFDYPEIYYLGAPGVDKVGSPRRRTGADGVAHKSGEKDTNVYNHGYDDSRGDYYLTPKDHIAYRYEIISLLGKGSFGQVAKCFDHKDKTHVALKIIRNKQRFEKQGVVEVKVLDRIRREDASGTNHAVHMGDHFYFRGHLCITFELLGINLYEWLKGGGFRGVHLGVIRTFTLQILKCLVLMQEHKIVHCDLKPENVLLVNTNFTKPTYGDSNHHSSSAAAAAYDASGRRTPNYYGPPGFDSSASQYTIKVIDFGSSCFEHERVYTYVQSRFYRSPEVILGINYTVAIDMWSLGCILAELFTGYPLFPGENEQEQLACIMEIKGVPELEFIERGSRKKLFFESNGTPRLVPNSKGKKRRPSTKTLTSVLRCHDPSFINFIERCLTWDPEKRMTPSEALQHEWILGAYESEATLRREHGASPSGRSSRGSASPASQARSSRMSYVYSGQSPTGSGSALGGITNYRRSKGATGSGTTTTATAVASNKVVLASGRTPKSTTSTSNLAPLNSNEKPPATATTTSGSSTQSRMSQFTAGVVKSIRGGSQAIAGRISGGGTRKTPSKTPSNINTSTVSGGSGGMKSGGSGSSATSPKQVAEAAEQLVASPTSEKEVTKSPTATSAVSTSPTARQGTGTPSMVYGFGGSPAGKKHTVLSTVPITITGGGTVHYHQPDGTRTSYNALTGLPAMNAPSPAGSGAGARVSTGSSATLPPITDATSSTTTTTSTNSWFGL
ncbi:hypothetical protein BJ742DRAFT_450665 [Cladochytrium replicatum]|nr:hypothetical protein BJ742DRAFT_450665 [Cladochytrium replicatum]